jgi:hypothetical protein
MEPSLDSTFNPTRQITPPACRLCDEFTASYIFRNSRNLSLLMRLLQRNSAGQLSLTADLIGDSIPKYAILSHTWGGDTEEVTFEDMINSTGEDKPGYEKIRFCGEQARQDGLLYFWINICCINKRNDAELSRSINTMFRWYRNATRCYVYLSDVPSLLVD